MSKRSSGYLLSQMWHNYVKKHLGKLSIAVFFMLLEGAAMFVLVKSLKPLFDEIFTDGNQDKILPVTLAVCGVFVIKGFGSFIHRSLTVKTGTAVVGALQQDLTNHLLTLDISSTSTPLASSLSEYVAIPKPCKALPVEP